MKTKLGTLLLTFLLVTITVSGQENKRWSTEKANDWWSQQRWIVGSNYVPTDAINQLEMWQADTFDPAQIDKEFGWAQDLGMNTMRVFLHDLLWQQDPEGFKKRIDIFLTIADRHHIRPVFVIFDSLLGPSTKARTAASADPWRPQLRMGAEPRHRFT